MYLYNTLTRQKELFTPTDPKQVTLYTCGPTVYHYAHIGNLRAYVFEDILKRALKYSGYPVLHVMNITDVGHLTSDADEGEDKIEKGARREGKTVWEIANFYTKAFKKDIKRLNIRNPDIWCKATDHIPEQIALIQTLEQKGLTYKISDGIYFNTSKFPRYGDLAQLDIEGLKEGARIGKHGEKRNPSDFALWKFSPKDTQRQMEWDSPWGKGFPGWHIECSAMSMKYLGETIDIHCGGIDHISVHHTNEIAQSESATGKPFVRYWLHGEHLLIGESGEKMAKSGENFITLQTLMDKGIDPLAYRYLLLTAHYRSKLQFSWESLEAAQTAYYKLRQTISAMPQAKQPLSKAAKNYKKSFISAINDDLNAPRAIALLWEIVKSDKIPEPEKKKLVLNFDRVLGLNLGKPLPTIEYKIPQEILALANKREEARKNKNWPLADQIREDIEKRGYTIEDTKDGYQIKK
ncbi:MAG: cysteine--tRNA ligase [Parcubacteria group bacterium]|nr:cysteine--tRNA ligase [Parcubacteria group bacterium]